MKILIILLLSAATAHAQELTANTPAVNPGITADTVIQYLGYLVSFLTVIISLYKSHKAGQNFAQSLILLANTLKDESKMVGGQFTQDTLKKVEEVATTIGANDEATKQVKQVLKGKELDIKLGSWRGKPIYLSDAMGVGGLFQGLKKLF